MTIAAIIAEYNPFHNGHEYLIKKTKEETGADYMIAVMSGDFTQRGIPGIADKHTRAKWLFPAVQTQFLNYRYVLPLPVRSCLPRALWHFLTPSPV